MIAPHESPPVARVLVALGAAVPNRSAIEAGLGLAAGAGASLVGLFVEDVNLVRSGALPFASVTSVLTGTRRALAEGEMERALRVEAARLEHLLGSAAARTSVECRFTVTRGELFAEAAACDADLVVLGGRGTEATEAPAHVAAQLVAVFDESPAALRALAATAHLARGRSRPIVILVPEGEPATSRGARESARGWLAVEQIAGLVLPLAATQPALETAVRSRKAGLLALPASLVAAWPIDLATLSAAVRCPLVISR